ncbi:MAG: DUF4382 domain-containing protein [Terrimonas sp.]|nr:DUF4382 domain-containing protein [Terrimonas sp.]
MKTWKRPFLLLALLAATTVIFIACQKDNSYNNNIPAGQNKLSVYLTDGPYDFQQVLVDIRSIAVKIDTCQGFGDDDDDHHPGCDDHHDSVDRHCEIWDTLDINPGVYDLLSLRNGVDTLLASGFVLNGKIERIKLVLGDNNSIMVDSVVHPLHLFNNWNSVYINIHREHLDSLSSNNFQLYLDFDLARSILYFNGNYWLKPVLKPFGRHSSGEIEGKVRPVHSYGTIYAFNDTDTSYAMPYSQGEFKIRGLQEGTYSLFIDGINGYRDTTITDIMVRRNREVKLGTIQLTQ